jgi:tetratricopeptide (TPR) repeat protein
MRGRKAAAGFTVLTAAVVAIAVGTRVAGEAPRTPSETPTRQDQGRFQKAYALIQAGDFDAALSLLEQNIAETPDATDIDYAYGWAVVCAAHLGDVDRTLTYYKVLRTRFGGWKSTGAGGANRIWDHNLTVARQALQAGGVADKKRVLQQLDELDRLGRESAVRELKALIRRVQAGDQIAIEQLRSTSHIQPFIDLIVDGELGLVGEGNARSVPDRSSVPSSSVPPSSVHSSVLDPGARPQGKTSE